VKPKKSYGQHFLINESLAEKIVDVFDQNLDTANVLEVGPGKGAITKYILRKDYNYKAIEADRDMIEYLWRTHFDHRENFLNADFLKIKTEEFFNGEPFAIIGNFPYNISSQIIFKIEENKHSIPMTYGMFQREVAERIVASHGSKTYGILSVIFQSFFDCSILQKISAGSFFPPPKVNSAMVLFKRKKDYSLPCDEKIFKRLVKISFNQRRKMLRNSIKSMVPNDEILNEEIFSKRPEQLSKESFYDITNKIGKYI